MAESTLASESTLMQEVMPLCQAAAAAAAAADVQGFSPLREKGEDCGLAREGTGSTHASSRQKANREASAETSDLPSISRPSREVSGDSVHPTPKAVSQAEPPRQHAPPRPSLQPGRLALAAVASLALAACVVAAAVHVQRPDAVSGSDPIVQHPRGSTSQAHSSEDSSAPAAVASSATSALALFQSPELHDAATENLMAVGRRVLTPSDRHKVHAAVAAGFKNMSIRLRQHAPKAAKVLDGVRFHAAQKHAVLKTLRLLSDRRVQSIGFDVAKAIRESGSKDHWVILDRIHRRLRPRVGEIRMLRDELLPSSLLTLASGHHWDLTLSPANVQSMADVGDAWALELGAREFAGPGAEAVLSIFRKLGAAALSSSDSDVADGDHAVEGAGGLAGRPAEPRELAEAKALGIAAGVSEQGRYLLDVLRLSALSKDGHAHNAPVGASALTGALSDSLGPEEEHGVSCSNPATATEALLCPLKFGTQGLDALRAVVEIRVLRR